MPETHASQVSVAQGSAPERIWLTFPHDSGTRFDGEYTLWSATAVSKSDVLYVRSDVVAAEHDRLRVALAEAQVALRARDRDLAALREISVPRVHPVTDGSAEVPGPAHGDANDAQLEPGPVSSPALGLVGAPAAPRAATVADVSEPAMDRAKGALAQVMAELEAMRDRKRKAYLERSRCVALVARMAIAMGFRAGVRDTAIEHWSDEWHGCVYVDLPTGQVSWHYRDDHGFLFADLPPYPEHVPWDGHDTIEKYARVAKAFGPACAGFGGRVAIYDAGDFTTIADCGNGRWAVRRQAECLSRSGSWEDEPPPSRRDDAFLERCRFEDPADAWQVLHSARAAVGGTWEDASREMTGGSRC